MRCPGSGKYAGTMSRYLPYSPDVETIEPAEPAIFAEMAATMRGISERVGDQQRHYLRPVHAKSHGLLRARLTVLEPLTEPYAQGLFASPESFDAVIRLSTNPGDLLADSISSPRGFAIKVLGPERQEMLPGHEGRRTQDFLCVNAPTFPAPNAAAFLEQLKTLAKHATDSPELKQVISTTAQIAETVIEAAGGESATLKSFGHPQTNILGETFYTQAPLRYGRYIARIAFAPLCPGLQALTDKHLEKHSDYSALRDAVVKFFATERAEWEIRVQLALDLATTPVEDPSVPWPEDLTPYIPVARLVAEPQEAYSAARSVFVDEQLSFNPWHGLAAHQPLGQVNRARKLAYPVAADYRRSQNGRPIHELTTIDELPD